MNYIKFNFLIIALSASNIVMSGANVPIGKIIKIDSRIDGYHAVYINQTIPTQSCNLEDRMILDESEPGGKGELSLALAALTAGLDVEIRIDGCVIAHTTTTTTSPRIIRITIYK